jgi:hypothetical protein
MAKPIVLPQPMEGIVRFIEETEPERIVEATLARLDADRDPRALFAASAIAVSRSSEIQIDHHGGPLHQVAGLHAIMDAGQRGNGDLGRLAVVQAVALANRNIHAPEMGPAVMLALDERLPNGDRLRDGFVGAMRDQYPLLAEKYLLALLRAGQRGEAVDAMLDVALRLNVMDDHYFLYPMLAARTCDAIGWEWAPVVMRPVVRWLAMSPIFGAIEAHLVRLLTIEDLDALIERHRLLARNLRQASASDEDGAIAALGEEIGALSDFDDIPALLAGTLAGGLSLEGAGEALSIGGTTIHLRTNYGNPLDVHIHNGIATRRYLIGLDGLSLRNKLRALLAWSMGPEIRTSMTKLVHPPAATAAEWRGLPENQAGLLTEIRTLIEGHRADHEAARTGGGRATMVARPEVRRAMAATEIYLGCGHDPNALIATLAGLVARDDATEFHGVAGFHDAVEQYEHTRGGERGRHLVSATKSVMCSYGYGQEIYEAARAHLSV